MAIEFRPLRRTDHLELRKMIHELYIEDPSANPITDKKISRTITALSDNPNRGKIIVFAERNTIIGYSILIFYWSNEYGGNVLHIDELYVKPKYRGRGVATKFFRRLWSEHSAVAFQLEVTRSNKRALGYYRRLGFKNTRNLHLIRAR
jgi:ribosomal protein S18 acetylase RimI-like enzyme